MLDKKQEALSNQRQLSTFLRDNQAGASRILLASTDNFVGIGYE